MEGNEFRQLAIRIGEPYMMKDRDKQSYRVRILNEESAYTIGREDMAFSCVLMDYDAFVSNPEDADVFYEYVYCNSWNLVKDIDSPIYLRTKKEGAGYAEERWEELPDDMMENLRALLLGIGEEDEVLSSGPRSLLSELMGYFNQKSRDIVLRKLGI